MGTGTSATAVRRHIALSADQVLIIERADDVWMVALYRPRKSGEAGGEITPERWERMRKTWMRANEKPENWLRVAMKHPTLTMALAHILEHTRPHVDVADVRNYLQSVEWGRELLPA